MKYQRGRGRGAAEQRTREDRGRRQIEEGGGQRKEQRKEADRGRRQTEAENQPQERKPKYEIRVFHLLKLLICPSK